MKTGRRRSDRAWGLRKNSLITLVVRRVAFATDVGRERHRPARIKIDILGEHHESFTIRQNLFDPQGYIVDLRRRTESHLSAGLDQTFPTRRPDLFQKQELNSVIVRKSARGENASVVQAQQIARLQKNF